jgi:hypothetical protein
MVAKSSTTIKIAIYFWWKLQVRVGHKLYFIWEPSPPHQFSLQLHRRLIFFIGWNITFFVDTLGNSRKRYSKLSQFSDCSCRKCCSSLHRTFPLLWQQPPPKSLCTCLSQTYLLVFAVVLAPKTSSKKTMVHGLGRTLCNRFIRSINSVATVLY